MKLLIFLLLIGCNVWGQSDTVHYRPMKGSDMWFESHFEIIRKDSVTPARLWSIEYKKGGGDTTIYLRDMEGNLKYKFVVPQQYKSGHGYAILKDSRPGIPPLRLVIRCPYNNKDTIFILDSAAYYGRPTKLGGEYYMYGRHEWIFGDRWEGVKRQYAPEKVYDPICEPNNVSTDSLIKWHQWRMVQLMKMKKGMGGAPNDAAAWYFGPEAIRKWEEGHKRKK